MVLYYLLPSNVYIFDAVYLLLIVIGKSLSYLHVAFKPNYKANRCTPFFFLH
ncbi:unnamed protein product, partial [Rotaria magnacalcarata]